MTRRRAAWAFAAVLAVCMAVSPNARAAPRVVVVHTTPEDAVVRRIVAELEAVGFEVVDAPSPAAEPPAITSLEETARAAGAAAAIRITASGHGVEVWIVDRVTRKTVLREVIPEPSAPAASVAVQAVELLRASLLEIALPHDHPLGDVGPTPEMRGWVDAGIKQPSTPAPPTVAPPPTTTPPVHVDAPRDVAPSAAPPRAARSSFGLEVAPAITYLSPDLGPAVHAMIGARWTPTRHLGGVLFTALPLTAPSVDGPGGSTDVRLVLVGGGLRLRLGSPESVWEPHVEVGVAAAWAELAGSATKGYIDRVEHVTSALPYARAGLAVAIAPPLYLRLDVLGGAALPHPVIAFANREVTAFGAPLAMAALGVEVAW